MSHADNALTFGGDPEQHIARDAAFEKWVRGAGSWTFGEAKLMKHVFDAGWAARGAVNYPENKSADAVDPRDAACKSEN